VRTGSLFCLLCALILSLSSFYSPPLAPPFTSPMAVKERRPAPLPYVLPLQYASWVIYYCDETGVPIWLACRMFGQESVGNPMAGAWDPDAVSWMGAQGLAQIMPVNLLPFSMLYNGGKPIDPFDPETAIRVGLRFLADLRGATGSWRLALLSYNGGLGHWSDPDRWGPWRAESTEYVRMILREG